MDYKEKFNSDMDNSIYEFKYNVNNIVPETIEYINTKRFNNDRKRAIKKVILSSLLFLIFFQLVGGLVFLLLSYSNIGDIGIISIFTVLFSIIPIYLIFNKSETSKLKVKKNKFTIIDLLYFFGLMYLMSIIFSNLTLILMQLFNISSVDVTNEINQNMNISLFIYATFIGPFFEELQFRGYYLNHLRKYGASVAIIVSSITFSFMHLNFIQSFGTIGIALVIGYVGYFYSFKAAIMLHILNNFFVFLLGYLTTTYGDESPYTIYISIFILILMLFSVCTSFWGKRKKRFYENMGHFKLNKLRREFEIINLRSLLNYWLFWVYLILMISISIIMGFAI